MLYDLRDDTICAISSPPGMGAIAVIRITGIKAFEIGDSILSVSISNIAANSCTFCRVIDQEDVIDEVLVNNFRSPKSYTGEDTLEISCHGSTYIQQKILEFILLEGARLAEPGEFTLRAYMNGKMDLTQAEAVGDLIHSNSHAAHQLAVDQMKGGFGKNIKELRDQLIEFASLIELELDFSEEDVEFADRSQLNELVIKISKMINNLADSFRQGNAIKNGVPVAIIGPPNAGKSTLLNALLKEDKAIVSEIAGTTRDSIEDVMIINGVLYRFIDTAGIRKTKDVIESMGIERSYNKAQSAHVVLFLLDASANLEIEKKILDKFVEQTQIDSSKLIVAINKSDISNIRSKIDITPYNHIKISAKNEVGLDELIDSIEDIADVSGWKQRDYVVTNARHYNALRKAGEALGRVTDGLDQSISSEFLAIDIRQATHHLSSIIGEVDHEDLLEHIFANFCIGK